LPFSFTLHAPGLNCCLLVAVIHRLDRLTSGVLLLGKTAAAGTKYQEFISTRQTTKQYVCRVSGRFPSEPVVVNAPLDDNACKVHVRKRGKEAETRFELVKYDKATDTSVLYAYPKQGRRHQIRVHLKSIDFPIANDFLYNSKVKQRPLDRGGCEICGEGWADPSPDQLVLWLHALQYSGPGFCFRADPPDWALGL